MQVTEEKQKEESVGGGETVKETERAEVGILLLLHAHIRVGQGNTKPKEVWRWMGRTSRQRRNSHVWGLRAMPQQGTLYKGGLCAFQDGR